VRKRMRSVIAVLVGVLTGLATTGLATAGLASPAAAEEAFSVLVFSKTAGFRHSSIPAGIEAIEDLGAQNGFAVTATEDAGMFTDDNLAQYDAVVWLSTTGDVLDAEQQQAFERYVRAGGGYAGVHAASDTEYEWPWYGRLVGAYFDSHPAIQEANISVTDRVHPSTKHLPTTWRRTDEWYNYRANPRRDVHVLAELEESTYDGGSMGADHPTAWCQEYDGGRSWYTGGGHTEESYAAPEFRQHLLGGILTAAGQVPADCGATVDANFDQVTLAQGADDTGEPMGLAVLPDGGVLHTSRDGTVHHTTADGTTSTAAQIPVYNHDEDGLQGIAVDPDFEENGWVYLYYAPPLDTPAGDAPENGSGPADFEPWKGHNNLSRFKLENGTLDLGSEQVLLQVDQDRGQCCHNGGDIDFDAQGNLYLATGDDTNPFQSEGYAPIDERETRNPVFDAQRSAANSNDLRGKILRIHPEADGTYTIPEGNLFAESEDTGDRTRPEIYAMGFRNPFRLSVDQQTGNVYVGDYGPDAGNADPQRGPGGQVEFAKVAEPGFYGWPYCTGTNSPAETYTEWDFAAQTAGAKYDCAGGPENDSFRNTGLQQLPPAQPAWIPFDNCSVPELGCGSESPMGGPVYRYDPDNPSTTKFPAYYDGKFFAYEWGRGWIKTVTTAEDGSAADINPFFDSMSLIRPMDVEFGPDGSLYVLDYGSGYFGGSPESAVYRIDYVKGQRSPRAVVAADPTSGQAPLTVQFSSEGSEDPDPGDTLTYAWDFDGDGTTDSTEANPSHTYTDNGVYDATLTVTDPDGKTGTAGQSITVGNSAPAVDITLPPDGGVFSFGDQVRYRVEVTDPDGQEVDCSKVQVEYVLGHDEHGHPLSSATGCEGTIETTQDGGHDPSANLFGVLHASYTDTPPSADLPALTGEDEVVLQPRHRQVEHWSDANGVQTVADGNAEGGTRVGYIEDGDWVSFAPYNLAGVDSVTLRGASGGAGGTVELRAGAPDGPLVADPVQITNTGDYGNWKTFGPVPVTDPGDTVELFMVFKGTGNGGLFDVDSFTFTGKGSASNTSPSVSVEADRTEGPSPLTVQFTATATDADGDDLTYAWDFDGDGTTDSTELSPTHTYQEPGSYAATFTATDPQGLTATATVDVTAYRTLPACSTPNPNVDPDDEFDGSQLDTCRWTTIVRQDADHFRVQDGELQIDALQGDMFGGSTDARNLVLQDMPRGGWEAVTRMRFDSADDYAQAGLMVYGDDDNFVKAVLINVPGQGLRYELGQQVDGEPVFTDAYDRSGALPGDWPKTSYVKVAYDGKGLTAYYSADGQEWTRFGRVRSLHAIPDPKIGLGAFNGDGAPVAFDSFRLDRRPAKPCTPAPLEYGYEPLFNGTQPSLNKWRMAGPGGFMYADCSLLSYGGMGLYWYDREFSSYSLKLDWKVEGDDNSGVFVGSPAPGDDPWLAVNEGEEIQIDMTDDPDSTTGAIYNERAADAAKRDAALKPPGQWNEYEIVVDDDTITVVLNGVTINEWVDDDPNVDLDQGYIGLQNHGNGDDVWFRNVRVKELP
jgi:cytochrome c